MVYKDWRRNVEQLMRSRHPGVKFDDLDPNACEGAYQAGIAPIYFVTQGALPLRPPQPSAPIAGPSVLPMPPTDKRSRIGPVITVVIVVVVVIGGAAWWSQKGRSGSSSPFPPISFSGPSVISVTATATEEKASYSDTTWVHVNWFRLVTPVRIESKEDGLWTDFRTDR